MVSGDFDLKQCYSSANGEKQTAIIFPSEDHDMPAAVGMRFGRYELLEAIGAGGMGEVFRARDLDLERDVALHCLDTALRAGYSRDEIEHDPSLERLRADPRYQNLGKGEPMTAARKHR
jgi:hypothetical protein